MSVTRFTLAAALAVLVQSSVPTTAAAQASREGPSFTAAGPWGTVRLPDVAYDPANGVYLTVSGNLTKGRFVTQDGVPLGVHFDVPTVASHNQAARTVYSPDLGGFLVVWYDTRANPNAYQVWGRLVRVGPNGAPLFPGADFFIGAPAGGGNAELGIDVGYATGSRRFLVAYHQIAPLDDIVAQLVDLNGGLIGGPLPITADNHWQREPSVAYNPNTDAFMVAYGHYYNPAGPGAVQVRTVAAATGALGAPRDVATGTAVYVPQLEFNAARGQFFVAWYTQPNVYGRPVAADGSPLGNTTLLAFNYPSYDALGLAYNRVSDTYFIVFHGRGREDAGTQVSAGGVPDVEFDVTLTAARNGNYNPRVTSHAGRREWMMVTSSDFGVVTGQRIKTLAAAPPPPPPPPPPTSIELTGPGVPNGSWFFAEGAAGAGGTGFSTYYLLQNPNPVPVTVRAFFAAEDGRLFVKSYNAPARSRLTLSLGHEIGAGAFSTVFQSQTPGYDIGVERSMYFGPNFEVSTGERASRVATTQWLFAEGSRGGELFDNFYLLFNPTTAPAIVDLYFRRADGVTIRYLHSVLPQRRLTVSASQIPELAGHDFSVILFASQAIVAERSMYWRPIGAPLGTPWVGGHVALGSPGASRQWYFAEGAAAPGFDTFYLFVNPYDTPLTVNASFFTETHGHLVRSFVVPARSRYTYYLNQEIGQIGGTAAQFTSTTPFVVERSIYWGQNRVEGASTAGVVHLAGFWALPEGVAGSQFDTYLLLANPWGVPSTVDISLQIEGYGQVTLPPALRKTVPATGRLTIHMGQLLREIEQAEGLPPGSLANASFSTSVRVYSGPAIVAEHAIYWQRDGGNYWRAGTAAFGSPR